MEELNKLTTVISDEIEETVEHLRYMDMMDTTTEYVRTLGKLSAYIDILMAVVAKLEKEMK